MIRPIKSWLEDFGCDKIFPEKQSGKDFTSRVVYNDMRSKMRFGDVLVVQDFSRLGRNKEEIKNEWESLIKAEIDVVVLNMPILYTRKYKNMESVGQLIADLVLTLLSWMVEEERIRIRENQRQGIELAKQKGVYQGRKKKYHKNAKGKDKIIYDKVVQELAAGTSIMEIHRQTGLSRVTIYSIRDEIKDNNEPRKE